MRFLIVLALLCPILSFSQQNKSKPPAPRSSVIRHPSSPSSTGNSQRPTPPSILSIGDTLPPGTLNYKPPTTNHKLLILDFWATWCTSCLRHFPQLDSMQQQYNGDLQVLLVNSRSTGDNGQRVNAFFQKWKAPNGKPFSLPTLVEDTILEQHFPHRTIPHYVWLSGEGRVLAITGSEELTESNIRKAVGQHRLTLHTKADVLNYDAGKPLLVAGNGGNGEVLRFHTLIAGYIQGLPTGTRQQKTKEGLYTRLTYTNRSVLDLYSIAFANTFPPNRIRLKVPDTTLVTRAGEWGSWKYQNAWCYEILTPPTTKEKALTRMQQDLVTYFGYTAAVEIAELDTWVLQGTNTTVADEREPAQNLFAPGPKFLVNQPVGTFIRELDDLLTQPVCSEASGSPTLTLVLPEDLSNLQALNNALRPWGLWFTRQKRPWPVFVLRGNSPPPTSKEQKQQP